MIAGNERILLSLSAGKDSMFLLNAFLLLQGDYHVEIGVFHLNHMMRGSDSEADENHLVSMVESHGIEIIVRRHEFKDMGEIGKSFEEYARDIRYELLHEAAASRGYNKIATGHTRDDNVETLLMRIATGTGIFGLKGIPPVRGNIIRPLLAVSAVEIYNYLKAGQIAWREDLTNKDSGYSRNFIRNELLPLARTRFPMIDSALSALGDVATDSVDLLDRLVAGTYPGIVEIRMNDCYIDVRRILHDRPAFNHVVSSALRDNFSHHVNRSLLNEIFAKFGTVKSNAVLFVNNCIKVEKVFQGGGSYLKISGLPGPEMFPGEWEKQIHITGSDEIVVPLPEIGISVAIKVCDYQYYQNFEKNNHSLFVTLGNNVDTIYIRNRRKGDRIKTECGEKKLKDLFIEWKLSGGEKERTPILIVGTSVAAVMPGLLNSTPNRVSSDFLVDKKSKKVISVTACTYFV